MKLLYSPTSPYARKVRVFALEKQLDLELLAMTLAAPDCPIHQHNPLGKVPALITDDGDNLYDSRVIVEYLDHFSPEKPLIPLDFKHRISVRRWEALADGVCDAAVAVMLEGRKAENLQDAATITKQLGKVERGLIALNQDLGENKWCVNNTFSLADIALGSMLGYLNLRFQHLHWQQHYPNLARHYAQTLERASFTETAPPQT